MLTRAHALLYVLQKINIDDIASYLKFISFQAEDVTP